MAEDRGDGGLRQAVAPDGRALFYEVGGPERPEGPPVVFLHGTLANRFAFRRVRPFLEDRRRVVLTVMRGHLEGDDLTLPADYGLATTEVADLLAVLETEGIGQADLFAHSTGGSIAIALAARHPERVRRMVLVEPTLLPLLPLHPDGGAMAARVRADTDEMEATAAAGDHHRAMLQLLDFIGGTAWHASDANHQRVIDNLAPYAPLTGPHARALAGLAVTEAEVRALPQPALLVYGRESAYFEATIAAILAALRPDLPQIHVDGSGHNSHLEAPDVVGPAAARFLNEGLG